MDQNLVFYSLETPLGPLHLGGANDTVRRITWGLRPGMQHTVKPPAYLRQAAAELQTYFKGQPIDFTAKLYTVQGTAFQETVWAAVRAIPYGQTQSYGAIAARIGKPKAYQAIGQCVGANPLPIVVPCHRVVGADGSLTGFAYGLGTKRFLLDLEQAQRYGKQGSLF